MRGAPLTGALKMDWRLLLSMFAKPLGGAINNALAGAAGAVVAWSVTKGADAGTVAPIAAAVVSAISMGISALAATQGVQIPIINSDPSNGVRVVSAKTADQKNIPTQDGPLPSPPAPVKPDDRIP